MRRIVSIEHNALGFPYAANEYSGGLDGHLCGGIARDRTHQVTATWRVTDRDRHTIGTAYFCEDCVQPHVKARHDDA